MAEDFKPGQRIQFQVQGDIQNKTYYGHVTRLHNGQPLIKPDIQFATNVQLINIEVAK